MSVRESIETKLRGAFDPLSLTITDESELHRGHSGFREGGETHFRVAMTSAAFAGLGRVDRHRRVNAVLADELAGPVHALALKLAAPDDGQP